MQIMQHIDFTITQSSIDNGRLYFDAIYANSFPADAIGGRGEKEHAPTTVRIEAGGDVHDTDLRLNAVRISPRKSFKRWVKGVRAVSGGRARIYRISERHFRLEYLG